jgi:hypothetical protein
MEVKTHQEADLHLAIVANSQQTLLQNDIDLHCLHLFFIYLIFNNNTFNIITYLTHCFFFLCFFSVNLKINNL